MAGQTQTGSIARTILKGIAITGMVLMAASSPYGAPRLLQALGKELERRKWRQVQKVLHDLKKRKLVRMKFLGDGALEVRITKKGDGIVRKIKIDELAIPQPNHWDERWRVMIFDIPNHKHKYRLAFIQKLKNLGFRMIQKSVWVHPYPCDEEIMIVRKFYGIEPYVTYLETAHVEDENVWREKFDLPFRK